MAAALPCRLALHLGASTQQTAMRLALERPDQPEVASLVEELDAYQGPLYPPESHHGTDIEALKRPNVLFAVVRSTDGRAIGCGAVVIGPEYGELKRMFVRPEYRGQGAAKARPRHF